MPRRQLAPEAESRIMTPAPTANATGAEYPHRRDWSDLLADA